MEITLHQEKPNDHEAVFHLIKKAFENEEISDHDEQHLVNKLRQTEHFIPELSIVAKRNNKVVGHILLSKIEISNGDQSWPSLALAPITVLPEMQGKGIGGKLIEAAHERAKKLGHKSIVLLGHKTYYERFGYECADKYDIEFPFAVPQENCLAIQLQKDSLKDIQGKVNYPKPFFLRWD